MGRYKINVPPRGSFLYGDDGVAYVGDTDVEAFGAFVTEHGMDTQEVEHVHSYIGMCRAVTKRAWEDGDCHEDAEVGDTTVDYRRDDGRELGKYEVRCWLPGPPHPFWGTEAVYTNDGGYTGLFRVKFDGQYIGGTYTSDQAHELVKEEEERWLRRWKEDHPPFSERMDEWPAEVLVSEFERLTAGCSTVRSGRKVAGPVWSAIWRRFEHPWSAATIDVVKAALDELKWGRGGTHLMALLGEGMRIDPAQGEDTVRGAKLKWLAWGEEMGFVEKNDGQWPFERWE